MPRKPWKVAVSSLSIDGHDRRVVYSIQMSRCIVDLDRKMDHNIKRQPCASVQYILSLGERLPSPFDGITVGQGFQCEAAARTKGLTSFFFNIQSLSLTDFRFPLRSRFLSFSLLLSNGTCSSSVSRPFGNCCCCPPPPPPTNKHKNTFFAFLEFG